MKLNFRKIAIASGAALLSAVAAMAAEAPAGIVSVAEKAEVDGASVTLGANVYAGDKIETAAGGALRLRVGTGQLFLQASTAATLAQESGQVNARLANGTAGFSATSADGLEIETPIGTLRPANSSRAFGQVTISGPNQITVTSYQGDLLFSGNGEERMIEAGKSYRVSLAANATSAAAAQPQNGQGVGTGSNKKKLLFDAIVVGGAAVTGYVLWTVFTESDSNPGN